MLDDTGVFDTSLSWEYIHVSTAYGVSMQDILALSCNNLFYDLSFKIICILVFIIQNYMHTSIF